MDFESALQDLTLPGDGITLHAKTTGPVDGPLLLLLHGFPEFWYGWRKQIGPLAAAGFRVVALDQRGYNRSGKPKATSDYTLDHTARDVIAVAKACGQERVAVIGHDWGAAVAWWLASFYPRSVSRVGILNVPHPLVLKRHLSSDFAQLRRSWYMFFLQIPWLPETLMGAGRFKALGDSLVKSGRPGAFTEEDLVHYREAWAQPGALTAMVNWYRALIRAKARPLPQERIAAPLLLLWGEQDPFVRKQLADESLELCANATAHFHEQATHWIQHEEPQWVNERLIAFFRSGVVGG